MAFGKKVVPSKTFSVACGKPTVIEPIPESRGSNGVVS
jgi:hypothetical protein